MFKSKEEWDKFISLWNFLVLSSTELEYNEHLARLLTDFDTYSQAMQDVSQSWLNPYKDKFAVWTDSCMHFGNVTTNKAKSAHAKLKRQLGSNQVNFECSWTKIHSLLELQHVDIKASFEKSLIVVQHQFKPSHFRELRSNISITALDHVLVETKRANDAGIDASVCGCVVRRTHRLPCAHKIADYIRQGHPIPLDSINPHWRTLELVQKLKNDKVELSCEPKFDLILKRFNTSDYIMQLEILHKLKEIANPQSTFLIESDVKPNPRSKGHKKIPTQDSVKVQTKRLAKEKVYRTCTTNYSYVDALPVGLKPYIRLIKDVDADGNCGFRAIAGLMGLTKPEWGQVRRDLLQEFHTHVDHYTHLYGSHDRIEELTDILSYFEPNLGYHRWMTMPDMGHLIASCYNVVLYLLSAQQCLTFLPLRLVPISQFQRREIAIGFVNGNHFV
ncbi:uncharacterized protein LOC114297034 [Camellia sinensis]|uniref:uncharacterized protein LOC114297034 n=1 Tax=Camellia sinensis TaxID=4442 RepID=UPI0010357CA5|nr:uncharacterized protein LOC114297034 [Camellia sinensis]